MTHFCSKASTINPMRMPPVSFKVLISKDAAMISPATRQSVTEYQLSGGRQEIAVDEAQHQADQKDRNKHAIGPVVYIAFSEITQWYGRDPAALLDQPVTRIPVR